MSVNVAYLAAGKLHLKMGSDEVRVIESRFGQNIRERAQQIHHRNSWKTQGTGAKFMAGGMLWGVANHDPAEMRITITGLSRGRSAGELLYALDTDDIGGIFAVKNLGEEEQRISHSSGRRVRDLCTEPGREHILCSVASEFGTGNIAMRPLEGSQLTEVTEGDSLDVSPRWIPGTKNQIVFQSAGIGRDANGVVVGYGPFSVQKLNLDTGEMMCLAEDSDFDLLGPQMDKSGDVYFIRRPYALAKRPGVWALLGSVLLVPFQILLTLFQWMNFRSMMYTGKPLNTSGDARQQQIDIKKMMIWGNMINAEKAVRDGQRSGNDAPSLVPKTWELVRKGKSGEEVIAKSVLSFDLCGDGSLIYSNGSAIDHIDPMGRTDRIVVDQYIEQVIAVGAV